MTEKNGKVWVSAQLMKSGKPIGDVDAKEDMILVDAFEVPPATSRVNLGMTVNIGNFESLRVDSGVEIPCYKEELPEAQEFCFSLAEKFLFEKVREVKDAL